MAETDPSEWGLIDFSPYLDPLEFGSGVGFFTYALIFEFMLGSADWERDKAKLREGLDENRHATTFLAALDEKEELEAQVHRLTAAEQLAQLYAMPVEEDQ